MLAGQLNVSMMRLITGEGEGIDGPVDGGPADGDVQVLRADIRQLRTDMLSRAEEVGRLEKRLRSLMADQPHA